MTAQKEPQGTRGDSGDGYQNLFAANPHPMWVYDLETLRFLAVNDAAIAHYGYSHAEFLEMTIADMRPQEDVPRLLQNIQSITTETNGGGIDAAAGAWRHRKRDGSLIEVEIISHTVDFCGRRGELVLANDITERMRVEAVLRDREERLRLAIQASNVGLWDWNLATNVVNYSREWKNQIGYEEHEIAHEFSEWERRVHPADLAATMERIEQYQVRMEGAYEAEFRLRHKDGSWRWINSRGQGFRDANGKPTGMLGCHVDITERKLAEEALRESEAYKSAILDSALDCIVTIDHLGLIVDFNSAAERTFGYQRHQVLGRTIAETIIPPTLREAHTNGLARLMATGEARALNRRLELIGMRADGTEFPVEVAITRLPGEPARFTGFLRDITKRKQIEEGLRLSEQSSSTLLKNLSGMVYHCRNDAEWTIGFISDGCFDITGYRSDELRNNRVTSLGALMHPDDAQPIWEKCQRNLDARRACSNEYRIIHRSGEVRWVWDQAQGVYAENGSLQSVEGLITDITSRKRAEAEHSLLEAQLRHAQKMEALGTLAGGIAHDFNNLLTAIIGNAELARLDLAGGHPALISVTEVHRAGQRAQELVHRILTFSRPHEQQLTPIHLQAVLEEAVTLLRSTLPAGVALDLVSAANVPAVRADGSQIHQIILNLATNAWHAMDNQSGRIDIRLEACRVDSTLCQSHPELKPGPHVRLSVSDTGKGMAAETLGRIFEPFFTTKLAAQGSGLGLSVVHGIVRGHGGAIIVESQLGIGSTFHLYFPTSAEAAVATITESTRAQAIRGSGEHILYLDDEEPLVHLAVRFLERIGYRVDGYTQAAQALAAFRANPHSYDLVITDFNMPELSGMEVVRQLMRIRPDVLVVLVSGYLRPLEIEQAHALGVREIVRKPNTIDELGPVVQRLLSNRTSVSEKAVEPTIMVE